MHVRLPWTNASISTHQCVNHTTATERHEHVLCKHVLIHLRAFTHPLEAITDNSVAYLFIQKPMCTPIQRLSAVAVHRVGHTVRHHGQRCCIRWQRQCGQRCCCDACRTRARIASAVNRWQHQRGCPRGDQTWRRGRGQGRWRHRRQTQGSRCVCVCV